MEMKKTAVIDCFNTMLDKKPLYAKVREIAEANHLDPQKAEDIFFLYEDRLKYGEPFRKYDDLLKEALSYTDLMMDADVFSSHSDELIQTAGSLKPFDGVRETLETLKAKGYDLAVMSDGTIDMLDQEEPVFDHLFSYRLSAEEAGCYEPVLRFFEIANERFDLYTKDSIFITASYWQGVVPAARMGWKKIWIHDDEKKGRKKDMPYQEVKCFRDLTTIL